jgi:hypothetical protein
VQFVRLRELQSIVGLAPLDIPVGSIAAVGEKTSALVGVIVGLDTGEEVMLGVCVMLGSGVEVGGIGVQVAGRTTFVPVGAGVELG